MPDSKDEQAIFREGFGNELVMIARRLVAQGLVTTRDPGVVIPRKAAAYPPVTAYTPRQERRRRGAERRAAGA